eukprot:COSAG05_NODE_116_length_17986_cov_348.987534_9_plen_282_part_00
MSDNAPDIEKLRKLYYKKLLGTATLDELWRQVKKKKLGFKLREVKAFLKRQRGATLAKEFKRPKKFSSIVSKGTGKNWQADLMFIRREKGKVKANKFSQPLLNIVDVHSRFAWSVVIKDKQLCLSRLLPCPQAGCSGWFCLLARYFERETLQPSCSEGVFQDGGHQNPTEPVPPWRFLLLSRHIFRVPPPFSSHLLLETVPYACTRGPARQPFAEEPSFLAKIPFSLSSSLLSAVWFSFLVCNRSLFNHPEEEDSAAAEGRRRPLLSLCFSVWCLMSLISS